jgi:hypothetical protein
MPGWSDELKQLTFRELDDMLSYTDSSGKLHWLIGSNDLDTGARFKHYDGKRFGLMTAENAAARKWIIELDDGEKESFNSISDLINAGWAID